VIRLRGEGRPLVVGHRGAPVVAPENTIASFRAAVELGVDVVEFDVIALADGSLVVGHSTDLEELTHGAATGSAAGLTVGALRLLAGDLPTLDDALEYFASEGTTVGVQVDLKASSRSAEVGRRIAEHGLAGRAVLTSSEAGALRSVREAVPALAVGLSYPRDRLGISGRRGLAPVVALGLRTTRGGALRLPARLERAGACAAFLHVAVVSAAAVRRLQSAGVAVVAWTVDEPDDVIRVVEEGVDGVISNDPQMVIATITP
jgi:glycerophosphoryl diester phosphodiesterase